jgi:hypothetical protein
MFKFSVQESRCICDLVFSSVVAIWFEHHSRASRPLLHVGWLSTWCHGIDASHRQAFGSPASFRPAGAWSENSQFFENRLPVGGVKEGESLDAAARRVCAEEAGFVETGSRLPAIEVSEGDTAIRYTFFLATVVGDAADWETDRKRDWLPLSKVVDTVPPIFHDVARVAVEQLARMHSI